MKTLVFSILVVCLLWSTDSQARNTRLVLSIQDVLQSEKAKATLGNGVRFYFGNQKHPTPTSKLGTYTTNKKTNAFNKSDKEACEWVFLSALVQLRDRAQAEGGNAVVNVVSYYKKSVFSSATQFECHAGNVVAGVALRGDVVTIGAKK